MIYESGVKNALLTSQLKCFHSDKVLWGQIQASALWHHAHRVSLIMFIQIYYCCYKWLVMIVPYCRIALAQMLPNTERMSCGTEERIQTERKRKTDTCLPGHMSTSKTTKCWSMEERHLLTFCIGSPEKNNKDCWNEYGSPTKSIRLKGRMGKYFPYFQHPEKRQCLCKVLCAITLRSKHKANPAADLLVRKIFLCSI